MAQNSPPSNCQGLLDSDRDEIAEILALEPSEWIKKPARLLGALRCRNGQLISLNFASTETFPMTEAHFYALHYSNIFSALDGRPLRYPHISWVPTPNATISSSTTSDARTGLGRLGTATIYWRAQPIVNALRKMAKPSCPSKPNEPWPSRLVKEPGEDGQDDGVEGEPEPRSALDDGRCLPGGRWRVPTLLLTFSEDDKLLAGVDPLAGKDRWGTMQGISLGPSPFYRPFNVAFEIGHVESYEELLSATKSWLEVPDGQAVGGGGYSVPAADAVVLLKVYEEPVGIPLDEHELSEVRQDLVGTAMSHEFKIKRVQEDVFGDIVFLGLDPKQESVLWEESVLYETALGADFDGEAINMLRKKRIEEFVKDLLRQDGE